MIKCKDRQRELNQQLLTGMPESTYAASLQALYNDFLVNHRERKVPRRSDARPLRRRVTAPSLPRPRRHRCGSRWTW